MKRLLAFVVLVGLLISSGGHDTIVARPGFDSCTAALVGHAFTISALNSCQASGGDCTYEKLAVQWSIGNVLMYCFGDG